MTFYPDDAPVPAVLRTDEFLLRMLRASDVELDYEAVIASREILHLRSGGGWPREGFTLEENLADLRYHEEEFYARRSFTYTMMNPGETRCLGCVYIYPVDHIFRRRGVPEEEIPTTADYEGEVSFWVRQDRIADDLDRRLLAALLPWLRSEFAFSRVYMRASAAERRHVQILQEVGLRISHRHPVGDTELLLFE